jgi:hypothetical protein
MIGPSGSGVVNEKRVPDYIAGMFRKFPELFDVVGGLTRTVFGFRLTAALTNLGGQF